MGTQNSENLFLLRHVLVLRLSDHALEISSITRSSSEHRSLSIIISLFISINRERSIGKRGIVHLEVSKIPIIGKDLVLKLRLREETIVIG